MPLKFSLLSFLKKVAYTCICNNCTTVGLRINLDMHGVSSRAGDFISLDNRRVLHGRTAYSETEGGTERMLESGYVDWDELLSKRRVLMLELGKNN